MDPLTEKAIYHLLDVWGQYSRSTAQDGSTYFQHQCMSAGEDAAMFLQELGLGTEDGYGFFLNDAGKAIERNRSLRGPRSSSPQP